MSLHTLKLTLNKSMHAPDDEQDVNKLRPYLKMTPQWGTFKIIAVQ